MWAAGPLSAMMTTRHWHRVRCVATASTTLSCAAASDDQDAHAPGRVEHTWSTMICIEDKDPVVRPRLDDLAAAAYHSWLLTSKN